MKPAKILLLIVIVSALVVMPVGCATDSTAQDQSTETDEPATSGTQPAEGETPPEPVFELVSPALEHGEPIPAVHARSPQEGGENESVPLAWSAVPEAAESLALVMVDRHPVAQEWIHWMVVDIPTDADGLELGASGSGMPAGARELRTSWGTVGYEGPEPPPGSGAHDYEFTVYALDVPTLDVDDTADFETFLAAVRDHMIEASTFTGTFER